MGVAPRGRPVVSPSWLRSRPSSTSIRLARPLRSARRSADPLGRLVAHLVQPLALCLQVGQALRGPLPAGLAGPRLEAVSSCQFRVDRGQILGGQFAVAGAAASARGRGFQLALVAAGVVLKASRLLRLVEVAALLQLDLAAQRRQARPRFAPGRPRFARRRGAARGSRFPPGATLPARRRGRRPVRRRAAKGRPGAAGSAPGLAEGLPPPSTPGLFAPVRRRFAGGRSARSLSCSRTAASSRASSSSSRNSSRSRLLGVLGLPLQFAAQLLQGGGFARQIAR